MFEALVFDAPAWLWALPFPLLLAWWFSRAVGAEPQPTGALEVWRSLAPPTPRAARRSWLWPARTVLAVGALLSAIVALAQPRTHARESPTTWRVIVDASPAMAWQDSFSQARGRRAVAAAQRMLADVVEPRDEVEWLLVSGVRVIERSSEPDIERWSEQTGRLGLERPDWRRFDESGALWVTDRGEGLLPRFAGIAASGEQISEGSIASWPGEHLWGAEKTWTVQPSARAPRVALDVAYRASAIGRATAAWARARGVELVEALAPSEVELSWVFATPSAFARPAAAARDGWRIEGSASELGAASALDETWLTDAKDSSRALVHVARGRVKCAFGSDHVVSGDSAAFVVAWAELLDRSLLPVDVTVPLDSLLVTSAPVERAPQRPFDEREAARPLAHLFAACAALLAALAALWRR